MHHPSPRMLSRDFILTVAVNFFIATVFYLLITTMALYAVTRFAASDGVAGLAASSYVIGAIISRLLTGKYLDFVGRRRTIVLSLIVFVIASLLYLLAADVITLIALRFIHGLAFGAAGTAVAVAAVALIPPQRRGEGMSYYSIAGTLALGVGPAVGTALIGPFGFEAVFWASTTASVIGFVLALFLRLPERDITPEEHASRFRLRLSDMTDRQAMPIATVVFLACIGYSGVVTFYLNYAESVGDPGASALFFLVYSIAMLGARLLMGRIQDRYGDNAVFYPVLTLFTVGLVLLSLPPHPVVAVAAGIVVAFGFGSLMPSGHAAAVSSVTPDRVSMGTTTFYVMADSAIGLGPILLGALLPHIHYRGMYLGLAALMVVTVLVYHLLHGRNRPQPLASPA